MQDLSKRLPMYVWLVALSQLTSRICHPHVETQRITQHILTRVTAQFPQQVCPCCFHHEVCMVKSVGGFPAHVLGQNGLAKPFQCVLSVCVASHDQHSTRCAQALWQLAAVSKSTVYARQEAAALILSSAKRHSEANVDVQRLLQRFPEVVDQFIRLCNHSGVDKRCAAILPSSSQTVLACRGFPSQSICVAVSRPGIFRLRANVC